MLCQLVPHFDRYWGDISMLSESGSSVSPGHTRTCLTQYVLGCRMKLTPKAGVQSPSSLPLSSQVGVLRQPCLGLQPSLFFTFDLC